MNYIKKFTYVTDMIKLFSHQNIMASLIGFCSLLIGSTSLEAGLDLPTLCCCEPIQSYAPERIRLGHTEGKGLGYTEGYTSLDIFLSQPFCEGRLVPFVDLRGHVFNDKRYATNAGGGLRWLDERYGKVWGVNCYYDALLNSRIPSHQISVGLEALGETWDIRINGYLPVGHQKTPVYVLDYSFTSGFFLKAREQFAMKGLDAEVGYHFCKMRCLDVYAGVGPCFYWGSSQKTENAFRKTHRDAFGGRLRLSATFLTYCELEGVTTYDAHFKWTGQATLALKIPFDLTCSFGNQTVVSASCRLMERLFQPVIRNEIMVIDRIKRYSSNPLILDPEFEP